MSKIIQVLEKMGSDAKFQNDLAIEQLLITTEVETKLAEAISKKDIVSLERQLDVCPDVYCFFVPAKDDEPSEQEDENSQEKSISVVNI